MAKKIIVKLLDDGNVGVNECFTEDILGEEFDWCNDVLDMNPYMNKYVSDNKSLVDAFINNCVGGCLIDRTYSGADIFPLNKLPKSKEEFVDLERYMDKCLDDDEKLMDAFRVFTLSLLHQVTKDFIDD